MTKIAFLLSMSMLTSVAYADLSPQSELAVKKLVQAFQQNDRSRISQMVDYPLKRTASLPDIKSPQELVQRFDQVFDRSLRQQITQSKMSDWDTMGAKGIMFKQGDIWLTEDGKISSINYAPSTPALHSSLSQFDEKMLQLNTKQYHIRIDRIGKSYRYAVWNKNASESSRPDLVLKNGTLKYDGSARNHVYSFKSGPYRYDVWRNYVSASPAEGQLIVYKNGKVVVKQDAYLQD